MHEASVVEQLVKTVTQKALENSASKILKVNLVVGLSTGYMEESLKFYFEALSQGTSAEGAQLVCQYVKPLLKCTLCNRDFERGRFSFDCPFCGAPGVMTKIGSEFYIENMEVENG